MKKEKEFGGYIHSIDLFGKIYKLQCEVVEVYPMTCKKCGGQLELKYGHGECPYCNTHYSTQFRIIEE